MAALGDLAFFNNFLDVRCMMNYTQGVVEELN